MKKGFLSLILLSMMIFFTNVIATNAAGTNKSFNELRIYQVMVSNFKDADSNVGHWSGYGPGAHDGDLLGVMQELDYIKNMNFNAIWLTPVFNSHNGNEQDSNGYWTNDYFNIDNDFGGNDVFREFVNKAHEKGIYIILDGVFGHHGGIDNQSPSGNWPQGNDPCDYPESLNFYKEVATYWIKNYDIDGWRFDQSYQLYQDGRSYWEEIREAVEQACEENKNSGKEWGTLGYLVGEDWNGEDKISKQTYGTDSNEGLHSAFDFPTRYRLIQTLAREEAGKSMVDAKNLDGGFDTHKKYPDFAHPNLFLSNHDTVRFGDLIKAEYGYYSENPNYWKRYKSAFNFIAAYTGPITIYHGEEIGEPIGNVSQGSTWSGILDVARKRMKLDGLDDNEKDLKDYFTKLMQIRDENTALYNGTRTNLSAEGAIYADLKEDGDNKVLFILNIKEEDKQIDIPSEVDGYFLVDLMTNEKITGDKISIEGLSGRFLKLESGETKEITKVDWEKKESTVSVNATVDFPKLDVQYNDNTTETLDLDWIPSTIDTSKADVITYTSNLEGYEGNFTFVLTVKGEEKVIKDVVLEKEYDTVNQGGSYSLPKAKVTYTDNSKETVTLDWNKDVDTSKVKEITYTATYEGFTVTFKLTVKENVLTIKNVKLENNYVVVNKGGSYELPKAIIEYSNGDTSEPQSLNWNKLLITDTLGIFEAEGEIAGYNSKLLFTLVVKEENQEVDPENREFTWDNANIYFVITDRFYNGDTSNDNSYGRKNKDLPDTGTFHGGDILGLTKKLEEGYFDKLGVNAIWITAPYEQVHGYSGGGDNGEFPHYAYHGYYPLDYTMMDKNMGTVKEFKTFVNEAHKRGIRIVMDIVMNHAGYNTLVDHVEYGFGLNNEGKNLRLDDAKNYVNRDKEDKDYRGYHNEYLDYNGDWSGWWSSGWVRSGKTDIYKNSAGEVSDGADEILGNLDYLPDFNTGEKQNKGLAPLLNNKWNIENNNLNEYEAWIVPKAKELRKDLGEAPAEYIIKWLASWVEEFGVDGFRIDTAKHVESYRWAELKDAGQEALNNWRIKNKNSNVAGAKWDEKFWTVGEIYPHGSEYDQNFHGTGKMDSIINFNFPTNGDLNSIGNTWSNYAGSINSGSWNSLHYINSHDAKKDYGWHQTNKNHGTALLLAPGGVQIYYGDEYSRKEGTVVSDPNQSTRSSFDWDNYDNDQLKHWQKVGQFRRNNSAVGAGSQTDLGNNTYGRSWNTNKVVIKINGNGEETVNVKDFFDNGDKVRNAYNGETAVVSNNSVTFTAENGLILIEKEIASSEKTILTVVLEETSVELIKEANYEFPKATAIYSNGETEEVSVKWDGTIDTSTAGKTIYKGTVDDYNEELVFTLNVKGITITIENVVLSKTTETIDKGDESFELPKEATAYYSNDTTGIVNISWDSELNVNKLGTTTYIGTVVDYVSKLEFKLTVNDTTITIIEIGLELNKSEILKGDTSFELPQVTVEYNNETTAKLDAQWTPELDVNKEGTTTYTGKIDNYEEEVTFDLIVNKTELEITKVELIGGNSKEIFQGETTTLPKAEITYTDDSTKEVMVEWDEELDLTIIGTTTYNGTIDENNEALIFKLTVQENTILSFSKINGALEFEIFKGEDITLPTVDVIYKNNLEIKDVELNWEPEINLSKIGTSIYNGSINGFNETLELKLTVKEIEIKTVRLIEENKTVYVNAPFVLPEKAEVIFNDGSKRYEELNWDKVAKTDEIGTFKYFSKINGFDEILEYTLTVSEQGLSLEIYYKSDAKSYIHYTSGEEWTEAPGLIMNESEVEGYNKIILNVALGSKVQAAFNDGNDKWDNNKKWYYRLRFTEYSSVFTIEDGKILASRPGEFGDKNVTVYYKSSYPKTYMQFKSRGNKVDLPGKEMVESDISGYQKYEIVTIADDYLELAFNDGNGHWDSLWGKSYRVEGTPKFVTIENGKVKFGRPDQVEGRVITVYYNKNLGNNHYMHYKIGDADWIKSPGLKMYTYNKDYVKLDILIYTESVTIEAAFNDGIDNWDNNFDSNYTINVNSNKYYTIKDNKVLVGKPKTEIEVDTEAPVINKLAPESGTYNIAINVKLTVADNKDVEPKVYYTLDGTNPTSSSTEYTSEGIEIENSVILKLLAVDNSGNESSKNKYVYEYIINTIVVKKPLVSASYESDIYEMPLKVKLSVLNAVNGKYTINDEDLNNGIEYTNGEEITIDEENVVLRLFAENSLYNSSIEYKYTKKVEAALKVFTDLDSGEYDRGQIVTLLLENSTEGKYTTDGTDPEENGTQFNSGDTIEIVEDVLVKLYAKNLFDELRSEYNYTVKIIEEKPIVSANKEKGTYEMPLEVTLNLENTEFGTYILNGVEDTFINGKTINIEKTSILVLKAENSAGNDEKTYEYTKKIIVEKPELKASYDSGIHRMPIEVKLTLTNADEGTYTLDDVEKIFKNNDVVVVDETSTLVLFASNAAGDNSKIYEYTKEEVIRKRTLGANYTPESTEFIIWNPDNKKVTVTVNGTEYDCNKLSNFDGYTNVYGVIVDGELHLKEYQYKFDGIEVRDPYGVMVKHGESTNKKTYIEGRREENGVVLDEGIDVTSDTGLNTNIVIDLNRTEPENGWVKRPVLENREDSIIYEVHVSDFTIDKESGVDEDKKGKYLGMVQTGTDYKGIKTGIDHLVELGVSHVQLMPVYDFANKLNTKTGEYYNWGYDPVNFNIPEDRYASDPEDYDGRIQEFKTMVNEFHKAGIRVVIDVVYNHTFWDEMFDDISPAYYKHYSQEYAILSGDPVDSYGQKANMSGCGNGIDTDNPMVARFIRDSLEYWIDEFNVDGFRFDLMGIYHNEVVKEWGVYLNEKYSDRNLLLYGEPWDGYWDAGIAGIENPNNDPEINKLKKEVSDEVEERVRMGRIGPGVDDHHVGVFNGKYREDIKGNNDGDKKAYMFNQNYEGNGLTSSIATGIQGAIGGPGDDWKRDYTLDPEQSINYISAHDNLCLWDKVKTSISEKDYNNYGRRIVKFGMGMVLSSQGIPFMHAGDEFLRTKEKGAFANHSHNSYMWGTELNKIEWELKVENKDVFDYHRDLITLRKSNPGLRLTTKQEIIDHTKVYTEGQVVVMESDNDKEDGKDLVVVFNSSDNYEVTLPEGDDWVKIFDINGLNPKDNLTTCEGTAVTIFSRGAKLKTNAYISPNSRAFDKEEIEVKLNINGDYGKAYYTTDGSNPSESPTAILFNDGDTIYVGSDLVIGKSVEVKISVSTDEEIIIKSETYTKADKLPSIKIYSKYLNIWAWNSNLATGDVFDVVWPGPNMDNESNGWKSYTFDGGITSVKLKFNNNKEDETEEILIEGSGDYYYEDGVLKKGNPLN